MMDFMKAFEEIDTKRLGEITRDDLQDYMRKLKYDKNFIEKWMMLFDNDSGIISIEEYCDTIGQEANEDYMREVTQNKRKKTTTVLREDHSYTSEVRSSTVTTVQDEPTIISVDPEMSKEQKTTIIKLARQGQQQNKSERDIAKFIKESLDATCGRAWQVIVVRSNYGSFVTYEEGTMIHFNLGNFSFHVWRTPE